MSQCDFNKKCYSILHSDDITIKTLRRRYSGLEKISSQKYSKTHREQRLAYSRSYAIKDRARKRGFRITIIDYLGNSCCYCGFSDIRALQLDHIIGGGQKEIKKFRTSYSMYKYYSLNLDKAKEKLQVLCANCNWIKKYENREGFVG